MNCPGCGKEIGGAIICPYCMAYTRSRLNEFNALFEEKKRTTLFYLTSGIRTLPSKTYTADNTVTIRNNEDHTELSVETTIDGNVVSNYIKVVDPYLSHTECLTISYDGGSLYIMNSPTGTTVNGEAIYGSHRELESGDVIRISAITSFKIDTDVKEPTVILGTMSLVPNGFSVDKEFLFDFDGKHYFNGMGCDLMSCVGVNTRIIDEDLCTSINESVFGPQYLVMKRRLSR